MKINTLGEFNIRELFGGRGDERAVQSAGGWDGDLYEIVEKAGAGTAMIWVSAWDSTEDADQFRAGVSSWLAGRHPDGKGWRVGAAAPPDRVVWLVEGFDPDLAGRLERALAPALRGGVTLR